MWIGRGLACHPQGTHKGRPYGSWTWGMWFGRGLACYQQGTHEGRPYGGLVEVNC